MKLVVLAVLIAAVQSAGAPPPEVAVVLAGAGRTDLAEQMLARGAPEDGGGFRRAPSAFSAADLAACNAPNVRPEPCVREILAARGAAGLAGPPTVVVWLRPGPGFLTGWTCIGVGGAAAAAARQNISLDWSRGPDGVNAERAAGCVLAAAAESGW